MLLLRATMSCKGCVTLSNGINPCTHAPRIVLAPPCDMPNFHSELISHHHKTQYSHGWCLSRYCLDRSIQNVVMVTTATERHQGGLEAVGHADQLDKTFVQSTFLPKVQGIHEPFDRLPPRWSHLLGKRIERCLGLDAL